jgi:hypothetical protein
MRGEGKLVPASFCYEAPKLQKSNDIFDLTIVLEWARLLD